MKKLILIVVTSFLFGTNAQAQPRVVEKTFSVESTATLDINLRFGDRIRVEAWEKDEVSFRAVIEINSGKLNDALVLEFGGDESNLDISTDFDEDRLKAGRRRDCPENYSYYRWNDDDDEHHVVCSDIVYELKVPRGADLNVESISADIELLGLAGPVHAKSISGFVDLSWPEQQGADLSLKTISGEAYSNLENIEFLNKKEFASVVGYELRGKIGKGGPLVYLESISGDLFLRKK